MLLLRCAQLAWQKAHVMHCHHCGFWWLRYSICGSVGQGVRAPLLPKVKGGRSGEDGWRDPRACPDSRQVKNVIGDEESDVHEEQDEDAVEVVCGCIYSRCGRIKHGVSREDASYLAS